MKKIAALTLFVLIICGVLFVIGRVGAAIGCTTSASRPNYQPNTAL
ncbi:hypothetical protein SP37_74 [Salmonella phage 37]|uniref:Uncharacterized protein n=1 Tax=Salmonella phage 37 TaxID=1654890 RepID=A0A0N7C9Y0_9CAUD|nr:hypothetical protein SP37_74 [Salmonella phage 37]AKJ73941.1 hypothetical protein SP37_74 [Salmonella phage 37]